jgi:hypothetical protein
LSKDRLFSPQRKEQKEQGFDKLSPNGSAGSIRFLILHRHAAQPVLSSPHRAGNMQCR